MSRHTTYTVLDFIMDDEFVMEGSDDKLEDYVYDDSSNRDENIDIDDQSATPPFPLLHDSPLSSQIVNSPPSSPPNLLTITAERDEDVHQVHALQLAATAMKKGISRCWLCMNKQKCTDIAKNVKFTCATQAHLILTVSINLTDRYHCNSL